MGSIVHDSPTKPLATESVSIHITESANESEIAKSKNCPSPDIAVITSSSTNKPSKIPRNPTLTRRTTLKSKPKSRFGEPEFPIESAVPFGFTPGSPGGLSSQYGSFGGACSRQVSFALGKKSKDGIRPDEKEVYERVTAQLSTRDKKRMTVKLLIELAVFLCLLGCLVSSLMVKGWKRYVLFGLEIWKWFLLLLVIFSGMLVTHWIVHVIVFLIEWKFLLKKHVVYFTHGLKTSVEVFIWLSVVLATWGLLIKPDVSQSRKKCKILDFVTWSIVSLVIGAFLWLVKTALLKLLASSFHLNRFFDRIQVSVFHHCVLQTLSGRPVVELTYKDTRKESQVGQVSMENVKRHKQNKVVDIAKLHQMKQDKVPSWTLQLLVDVVSNSGLSTLSGMLEEDMVEGGVELDDDEITSEEQAIATAFRIFKNVVQDKDDQSYIDRDDLERFLISEEVDLLFPLFEVNETEKITLKAFAKWVVKVYKDRLALQHALNDNKTAVRQLDKLVMGILIVMIIVIWLLLTEIATTKLIVVMSSQLVVAAFIFGNTCKTIFEAIIFVFVMHPFDVGDRCVLDGATMVVEEMNILNTVFLRADNEKVYFPNSVLATKAIGNYYRSPDQSDTLEFSIDFNTPLLKIGELKGRIRRFLEQNPTFWHPQHNVVVKEIEDINKIKMALFVNHTMNFQELAEKNRRRSELVLELKKIFEQLDIKYGLLPQEISLRNLGQQG